MAYKIRTWIPVDEEEQELYESLDQALDMLEQLKAMHPENIYKLVEVRSEPEVNDYGDPVVVTSILPTVKEGHISGR